LNNDKLIPADEYPDRKDLMAALAHIETILMKAEFADDKILLDNKKLCLVESLRDSKRRLKALLGNTYESK
jgi:hypothetical protein